MKKKTPDHKIELNKIRNCTSPLTQVVNEQLDRPYIKRIKYFAKILDPFHLKNTMTSEVNGREIVLEGKNVINFSSANYLGLDQDERIYKAGLEGANKYGNHSGCSRMFSSQENILCLETIISDLVGAEKTLIHANVSHTHTGVIPSLFSSDETEIFIDRYAHTSLYMASLQAKAKGAILTRVDCENLKELEEKFSNSTKKTKVVLIDGLYSMQGHIPPLLEIQKICNDTGTILYIDDAHGLGIYGERGGGVAELFNLSFENLILVGSLQKGVGAFGAFVSGSSSLIDFLRVTSKSYIFSGTLQPHVVEGALKALEISMSDEGKRLRETLHAKSRYIRDSLVKMGHRVHAPLCDSPIISVITGDDLRTLMAGRKVFDRGIFLNSVTYPAVPMNEGLLRISLNSNHSMEQIDKLLEVFKELKKDFESPKLKQKFTHFKEVAKANILKENYDGL